MTQRKSAAEGGGGRLTSGLIGVLSDCQRPSAGGLLEVLHETAHCECRVAVVRILPLLAKAAPINF